MAELQRSASSTWRGDLKGGNGVASTESGLLSDLPVTYASRFESGKGSNPEELVGAAHAACYSMFLSALLSGAGHVPESIETTATVTLEASGPTVTKIALVTKGKVPGIDQDAFQKFADDAKSGCPISKLLAPGLDEMTLEATLL